MQAQAERAEMTAHVAAGQQQPQSRAHSQRDSPTKSPVGKEGSQLVGVGMVIEQLRSEVPSQSTSTAPRA